MSNKELRAKIDINRYVTDKVGLPTLQDIMQELDKPGRDPRQQLTVFEFSKDVKELEDSLVLSIANSHSENIMTYQINNSLVDSSLCIYQNPFWEIPLNDSTNLEYGYHPLYGVCGYFIKYRKFRVIINSSCDRCTYEYHFQNNRNRYYIVLMHNDYELVNIIRLKRKR